jgi:DNA-binding PadR family transcriptional regulator
MPPFVGHEHRFEHVMFSPRGGRRHGPPGFGGPPPFHGGPPPFQPPRGFRGGRRARRGDIRMALLALLAERSMHGYEMLRELEQRSGAMWRPSAGSIYPTLQLLEDEGLIKGKEVDGKRTYSITEAGKKELQARAKDRDGEMPWEGDRDGGKPRELREAAMSAGEAAMQVARVATPEQMDRALAILVDARRKLYALLAEAP